MRLGGEMRILLSERLLILCLSWEGKVKRTDVDAKLPAIPRDVSASQRKGSVALSTMGACITIVLQLDWLKVSKRASS